MRNLQCQAVASSIARTQKYETYIRRCRARRARAGARSVGAAPPRPVPRTSVMGDSLAEEFERECEFVKTWDKGKIVSDDDKLAAYRWFKQATVGDIDIPQPKILDFNWAARQKWKAWKTAKGTNKETAMQNYIAEMRRQKQKYGE